MVDSYMEIWGTVASDIITMEICMTPIFYIRFPPYRFTITLTTTTITITTTATTTTTHTHTHTHTHTPVSYTHLRAHETG